MLDRREFDSLSIENQIEYINKELASGGTVTKICKCIGIGRSTVRDRFNKVGQSYDSSLNKYVSDNNKTSLLYDENKAIVPKDIIRDDDKTIITDKKVLKNLIGLSENYDKLMEILEWFSNDKDKINVTPIIQGIKINLPEENDKEYRKTVRINDVVWSEFLEFCNKNKEFKQKDLHSQALLEYIKNHS
ncbi:hypothetical protein ACJDU8_22350 [Clostridium sp. WILCCON 0269]|uniref:DNA-binding protein n=1 Tax=Candidatus Clostridium eludens TaxID=3381663 RepID=A0ABW8SR60_9CLOT